MRKIILLLLLVIFCQITYAQPKLPVWIGMGAGQIRHEQYTETAISVSSAFYNVVLDIQGGGNGHLAKETVYGKGKKLKKPDIVAFRLGYAIPIGKTDFYIVPTVGSKVANYMYSDLYYGKEYAHDKKTDLSYGGMIIKAFGSLTLSAGLTNDGFSFVIGFVAN